jgi:F-type H+-transporting ATPase subunit b
MPPILTPDLGLLFWNLLAFLIAFFILKKFAWPAIIKGLNEREANISESLSMAEKVKAEMTQLKSENEALLAQAREERAAIIREAKELRDKMISEAREEAAVQKAKIISEAHATANNQKMAAMTELKNQIGKLVIEVSEKVLRRELGNKNEQEGYIKQLSDEIRLN